MKPRAVFFPNKTNEGLDLAYKIQSLLEPIDVELFVGNRFEEKIDQSIFLQCCLEFDVVIFDASHENNINNYDIANELMKHLNHVILVSRNYLPLNLFSVEKGGYPDYLTGIIDNDKIISWLKNNINKYLIIRPDEDKKMENISAMLQRSQVERRKNLQSKTNVFISFRTKFEKNTGVAFPFKYSVEELAERISQGIYHNGYRKSAAYLSNGALVYDNELLTEHRKWQLLSIIDDEYIINCDEFWIYASKDYFDSWWTQGELVTFADCISIDITIEPYNRNKKLKLYDPELDKVFDFPYENYPRLTPEQTKRKARYHITTNPSQMGPEGEKMKGMVKSMLWLFNSPFTQWMVKPQMKKLYEKQLNIYKQMNVPLPEGFDFDTFYNTYFSKEYLNDRAFSNSFWEDIEYIGLKLDEKSKKERYEKLKNLILDLDIDAFFTFGEFERIKIGHDDLRNGCFYENGSKLSIKEATPRYYFSPSRFGVDYSSTNQNLEVVPTLRFYR